MNFVFIVTEQVDSLCLLQGFIVLLEHMLINQFQQNKKIFLFEIINDISEWVPT